MPSSQEMRNQYPEFIIGGVDKSWKVTGSRPTCSWTLAVKVRFPASGPSYPKGWVELKVHPSVADWARAIAAVMLFHGYTFRETAGGSVACRKMTGSSRTTLHAHGVALDFNPSKNRFRSTKMGGLIQWGRQTDMPKALINDWEAIRTVDGDPVTEWGGRWWTVKDAMHLQASKCYRPRLEAGIRWSTVRGWTAYKEWLNNPTLTETQVDEDEFMSTKELQEALNAAGANLNPDGVYGSKTKAALVAALTKSGVGLVAHSHDATTTLGEATTA